MKQVVVDNAVVRKTESSMETAVSENDVLKRIGALEAGLAVTKAELVTVVAENDALKRRLRAFEAGGAQDFSFLGKRRDCPMADDVPAKRLVRV